MPFPFEVPFEQVQSDLDAYVDAVFGALRSEFLTLPKGDGFIEYPVFERGYEMLKRATGGFRDLSPEPVIEAVYRMPIALIVLRSMLGFTPPEWAYVTTQRLDIEVPQGAARTLDRTVRLNPTKPLREHGGVTDQRIRALVTTACQLLAEGMSEIPGVLHRLVFNRWSIWVCLMPWCSTSDFWAGRSLAIATASPNWSGTCWKLQSKPCYPMQASAFGKRSAPSA
jgi:hypothetical protein